MPSLGADMEAGTLVAWRRKPGERFVKGDIVVEVETDKGILEVEIFSSGVMERLLVEPGTKVPVGTPLAVWRDEAEAAPLAASAAPAPVAPVPVVLPPAVPAPSLPVPPATPGAPTPMPPAPTPSAPMPTEPSTAPRAPRFRASPHARALARELGVELESVDPTGPHGTIVADDVVRAARAPATGASAPAADVGAPTKEARMQRAIAASMARSKREIPHYYASHLVDLEPALAWMEAENARRPIEARLLPAVLMLRAVIHAASKQPELNAHWVGDAAPPLPAIHLGVAVALRGGGLVAPAILDAGRLSLDELMVAFKDVVERARAGRLRASELSSATITVTSLGDRGVDQVFPIVVPPQVAMVGFGLVAPRPFVVDGEVRARRTVVATLGADHRVTNGHTGGRFLSALAQRLGDPRS
jgi:pyruvate dehydrogenase E2 component (dihydrolipoamide acetyltransferase)